MQPAVAYIPIDRRLALSCGLELPQRAEGAALFADISGFTPLTEILARQLGPRRGAEELTRQLDVIYSAIIAEVDRFRGCVIGFAGDAITCWFDGDEGARAVACALAMQEVMRRCGAVQTPSGTAITLAIKVAVAAGAVRRQRVGDPAVQYIDTLAGATLYRMAEAEHHAGKGEVVVAAEVAANLGAALQVGEWRRDDASGHNFALVTALKRNVEADPWPETIELGEEQVRPWVHARVYERLAAGQGAFLAELRPAVALFMRFGGLDFDADETAGAKLDAFVRRVQAVVARYEGTLVQLTIGDKGSFLYSAFGAPVAHDDDAVRAVAAALELRDLPPDLDYINGTQIGISRGRMRVGAYGGPTARTYGVLGDEVNLAARLMGKAAPGEIMVSLRIAEAVQRHFELEYVGLISLKGKSELVPVSLVRGRRGAGATASLFANPLVGREAELAAFGELLAASRAGAGRVLRLEGPAGVGKSHLAAYLTEQAATMGFRVAVASCQSTTEGSAYAPWRQALNSLLHGEGVDIDGPDAATALEQYIAASEPDWLVRLPLLGDLLDLAILDNATTAAFEPRLRQGALFDLVVEMIQRWAQSAPLLLLLDDVHWLDEASRGLTVALARAIAASPLLLAVAQRPPLGGKAILPELDGLAYQLRLDLADLSPAGVAALVAHRLGAAPDELALALIQAQTQGNPFFVEEVVDALRESGGLVAAGAGWTLSRQLLDALRRALIVVWADGEWRLAPNAALAAANVGLPDSIQGVVLSRIDRLPEEQKLTVKVASVIGHVFALNLLARTHPLAPGEQPLRGQLAQIEIRDLARLEVPPPREAYMFKHHVTHDVAYETLLFDQRRTLHRAAGLALQELAPGALDQLAYHSYLGEDWPRALAYQLGAGQRALRLFANHEAIDYLEKALRCAEQLPADETTGQRRQIHEGLGQLLTATGQYEAARAHLDAALALAVALGDAEAQARACRWLARGYENQAEYPTALDWIARGLDALGPRETAARAEMLAIAGLINIRQGNFEQALEQTARSAAIAERLGDGSALAFAYNARAIISYQRGLSAGAVEFFNKALAAYQQAENIQGQAMSCNGIGNTLVSMGQWSEGRRYLLRARQIFNQTGDVYNLAFADNNLGEIARFQGHLDDALHFYEESLATLEQIGGSPYALGVLRMNLGATHARRGEVGTARRQLEASLACFGSVQARDYLPEVHRHLAAVALLAAEVEQAEAEAALAVAIAREMAMRGDEGTGLHTAGRVAAARGDLALAEQQLNEALAILTEVGQEYELARAQLSLAEIYARDAHPDAALLLLEACTITFSRLEADLDLAAARRLRETLWPVGFSRRAKVFRAGDHYCCSRAPSRQMHSILLRS